MMNPLNNLIYMNKFSKVDTGNLTPQQVEAIIIAAELIERVGAGEITIESGYHRLKELFSGQNSSLRVSEAGSNN